MSTPVEVWGPAFKNLPERLAVEAIFSTAEDYRLPGQRWCNLCETWVRMGELAEHTRAHQRERTQWRQGKRRSDTRAAKETLKQVNRLKRETKQIVGDRAPGDGVSGPSSPGGRPSRSARKENVMGNTATAKRVKPLSDAREKKLVSTITKEFASRSEDFRKGAIVYGRKLMKLDGGLRASRPPVPPALQSDDREKTRATCASVATALGLDPVKLGLASTPTVADDMQAAAAEKSKSEPKKKGAAKAKGESKTKAKGTNQRKRKRAKAAAAAS